MLNRIKSEFTTTLSNLDWIDEETRIRAVERLSTSHAYVGYPNELLDGDRIEARYYGVIITLSLNWSNKNKFLVSS